MDMVEYDRATTFISCVTVKQNSNVKWGNVNGL